MESAQLDVPFETRWAEWVARGRAHEHRVRRRLMIAGASLVLICALVYAFIS